MDYIGQRIQYLRDKSGLTQSALAKLLGISRSAVNSWEMAITTPSLSNIVEMALIFNVTTDSLLFKSQRMSVDITELNDSEKEIVIKLISSLKNRN